MLRTASWAACLLALGAAGCTTSSASLPPKDAPHSAPVAATRGRLRVTVSIDWEGAYLSEDGVEALVAFREALPDVPITHWICPAYLVKADGFRGDLRSELEILWREGDEAALHLHGWASLARAARVTRKEGPSFFTPTGPLVEFEDGDDGFDLELGAYSPSEFRAILRKSESLLASVGVETLPMFRGGAGILEDDILEALVAEGYVVDTSLIQAQFWRTQHGAPRQMGMRVEELWGTQGDFIEPFWIETPRGKLLEIPSAPGFGDYATVEQFTSYIDEAARRLRERPERDQYVHLGFHQENADLKGDVGPHSFRMRVQRAIEYILATYPSDVVFETMSQVAQRHGAKL